MPRCIKCGKDLKECQCGFRKEIKKKPVTRTSDKSAKSSKATK